MLRVITKRYLTKTIKVNCWFCNENIYVSRSNKNSFICSKCDQYNGFKEDGDYNKSIPSQLYEELNPRFLACKTQPSDENRAFCNVCIDNETKKMQILNRFSPNNKNCYSEEYDVCKRELEKMLPLCFVCKIRVNEKLNEINNQILPDYIKWSTIFNRKKRVNTFYKNNLMKHLNVTPITIILLSLCAMLFLQIGPYMNFRNSVFEFTYEHKILIDFCLFGIIFTVSKVGHLRPSIKFTNSKLLFLFVIVVISSILRQYSQYIPSFLQSVFNVPIRLWTILIILDFCIRIVRLIKACSFSKRSFNSSCSPVFGTEAFLLSSGQSTLSPDAGSEHRSVNYCNDENLHSPISESSMSISRPRPTDTNSIYSSQSRVTINPFLLPRSRKGTQSVCSDKSKTTMNPFLPSQQNIDRGTSSVFGDRVSSHLFRESDTMSHRTAQSLWNTSIKSRPNEVRQCPSFSGRTGLHFHDDTESVFSCRTTLTRGTSPLSSTKNIRGIKGTQSSSSNSVCSTESYRSKKTKSNICQIGRKLVTGIVIGALINLSVMVLVAYLQPNIEKYFSDSNK